MVQRADGAGKASADAVALGVADGSHGLIFMAIMMVLVRTLGLYARTTRLPAAAKVQSVAA